MEHNTEVEIAARAKVNEIKSKIKDLEQVIEKHFKNKQSDKYNSIVTSCEFKFDNSKLNLDSSKIKGLVSMLVHLEKSNEKWAQAVEICAGGRMYNVVVQNEHIGAQLLEKGGLKKRITIIPLNKIKPFKLPNHVNFN